MVRESKSNWHHNGTKGKANQSEIFRALSSLKKYLSQLHVTEVIISTKMKLSPCGLENFILATQPQRKLYPNFNEVCYHVHPLKMIRFSSQSRADII